MNQPSAASGDAAGFVLAGGRSSRMGSDKALQEFAGKPLICHAIEVLHAAGLRAQIAGARSDLAAFGPVIPDATDANISLGPLSGICSALAATEAQFAVFLPVDMPVVPPGLIRVLLENARIKDSLVVGPSIGGFSETFPVVIQRAALPVLLRELADGRRGCFAALQAAAKEAGELVCTLPVEKLVQSGHVIDETGILPCFWFLNVNTHEDLVRAESIYSSQVHRVS